MDKELLRSVIIATGLIVIISMFIMSYIKNLKAQKESDAEDDAKTPDVPEPEKSNIIDFFSNKIASLKANVPTAKQEREPEQAKPEKPKETPPVSRYSELDATAEPEVASIEEIEVEEDIDPPARMATPTLIQFSLIANSADGFNGLDLQSAFSIVGLVYGSLKIYERLDANRLVDYGVACMQEPGTFPEKDLENFYCPGLVFFMQPGVLDNAQEIFDDFVETLQILAIELDGTIRDHKKHILKDATIQAIRLSL